MATYGFKRLHVVTHVNDEVKKKYYCIEGNKDEGATSTAEITGLLKESKEVPGSDAIYTYLAGGTGQVMINLGLIDTPYEMENDILGMPLDENGFVDIGESILPPDSALVLESSDLRGTKLFWGFFQGKFGKESENMQTKTPEGLDVEPEAITYKPFEKPNVFKGKSSLGKKHKGDEKQDEFLKLFGIDKLAEDGKWGIIIPEG